MKDYFESVGTIDACYFFLGQLSEEQNNINALEALIDEQIGYAKEKIDTAISLVNTIIEEKDNIGLDTSVDKEYLEKLKDLRNNGHN